MQWIKSSEHGMKEIQGTIDDKHNTFIEEFPAGSSLRQGEYTWDGIAKQLSLQEI